MSSPFRQPLVDGAGTRCRRWWGWLAAGLFVWRAHVVHADPNDQFTQGLLDRGLVQVAENEAIRRLGDPLLKPVDRVQWSLRLARAYLRHAGTVGGQDRQSFAQRAEQTLADLSASAPPLPRQEAIRTTRALLRAEHAELLAWEWQYGNGGEATRQTALESLRTAATELEAAQAQLAADFKSAGQRTPTQLADGELSPGEIRQLQRDLEHRLAATLVNLAMVAPAGPERDDALRVGDPLLQDLAKGWVGDLRTWEARLLRVRLTRIRGDFGLSASLVKGALNEQPARWLADRFTAELVRGQLDAGQLDVALDTLLQQSRQPGGLNEELRFLQVETLLAVRQLAEKRGDQATKEQVHKQAETIALAMPGNWGSIARSRFDRDTETSLYGEAVARLVREARSAYQAGELDQAVSRFEQAADLAVQEGQPATADELDYTRGSILIQQEQFAAAVSVFDRLVRRSPRGKPTRDADLLRAYGVGKLYAAAPSEELATQYVSLLEQHRQRYAGTASGVEATSMLAAFEEARQQWARALPLQLELANDPERGAQAQLRVAVLYDQIINHLRTTGQPVDAWEDRAVEDLATFLHRFPSAPSELSSVQAEFTVRLVRIVLAHREHIFREAARQLQPVLVAAEHQRREAERRGSSPPLEWTQLGRTSSQLMVVSLAGQGDLEAARQQFNQLALTEPAELLELLRGLSKLAGDVPPQHRQSLAHLQLDTAQQLRLQHPDLAPEQRRALDEAIADAYLAAGNDLNAAAFFDKLLVQSPQDRERLETAAALHQRIGEAANLRQAKDYWQRLERLQKKGSIEWLTTRLHIAECAVALGQREEARKLIGLTRLVYPELGSAELRQKFTVLDASAKK